MYTRTWGVKWNNRQLSPARGTLFLAKTFKFTDYDGAMSFLNDVASIVREENHHPEVAFNRTTVKIQTQTHDIPGPSVPVPDADGKIPRVPPGITLNDARLAIRIEKLFTEVYLADERGRVGGNAAKTPETLEEMQQVVAMARPRKGKAERKEAKNASEPVSQSSE